MKKLIIILLLSLIGFASYSQSQIYAQGGAIVVEKLGQIYSINAGHFDWRKIYHTYKVRDGIQKIDIELGTVSNIYDKDSSLLSSESALELYLNGLVNKTDVFISDQTTPMLIYIFTQKLNSVTIAYDLTKDSDSLTLVAGHNCTVGDYLEFWENVFYFQSEIHALSGNQITLEKDIPYAFSASSSTVERTNPEMNIDGSTNYVDFTFKPFGINSYDIYEVSAIIPSSLESDDSKFGGIASLTNGILIGKINTAEIYNSYPYNIKCNADFKLNSFTVTYTDKAGGGNYGTDLKKNFRETSGVVPRVLTNEYILVRIRDDLSGLVDFKVGLLGHIVID